MIYSQSQLQELLFGRSFAKVHFRPLANGSSGRAVGKAILLQIFSHVFGDKKECVFTWTQDLDQNLAHFNEVFLRLFSPSAMFADCGDDLDAFYDYYADIFLQLYQGIYHDRSLLIKTIEVRGLFGLHDFAITLPSTQRLAIIVGANGLGKTTVLKLIASLLRPENPLYEKTLFHVPFESFRFVVGDNLKDYFALQAFQKRDEAHGEVTVEVNVQELVAPCAQIKKFVLSSAVTKIRKLTAAQKSLQKCIQSLWGMDIPPVYFISADRFHATSDLDKIVANNLGSSFLSPSLQRKVFAQEDGPLFEALERVAFLLDKDLKLLLSSLDKMPWDPALAKDLEGIIQRNKTYPFGLDYRGRMSQLAAAFRNKETPISNTKEIWDYRRQAQRYCATVKELADRLDDFTATFESMDRYNASKRVLIDEQGKIRFETKAAIIDFDELSSGEINYFVMFFKIIVKAQNNSLLLIDEPEISLSSEIQQTLADKMLQEAQSSNFQIVGVTHSPFIGSGHLDLFAPVDYQSNNLPWKQKP